MVKKFLQQNQGFGLLEALIASGILALIVGGAVVFGVMLLRGNVVNSHRVQAVFLAQEGFEAIRQVRDSNYRNPGPATKWNIGFDNVQSNTAYYIHLDPSNSTYKVLTSNEINNYKIVLNSIEYTRQIYFQRMPNDLITDTNLNSFKSRMYKIKIVVSWQDYSKQEKHEAYTIISDWKAP